MPSDDHVLAHDLAAAAMAMLVLRRAELETSGVAPAQWGAIGDRAADDLILGRLRAERPADAVLSEESADDLSRLAAPRVWIIDPLDGTREFATPGRTDWAVHVALTEAGTPTAAAVALPDGTVLSTAHPGTAAPSTASPAAPRIDRPGTTLRMVVSRSRAPAIAHQVAARLGAEVVELGSAGAKCAAVLQGQADLYLHAGGMSQWDSCAPVGVALQRGFWASRIDGSPLRYNGESVDLPDLLVCRAELARPTLAAVAALTS